MILKMNSRHDFYLPKVPKRKPLAEKQITENEAWIAYSLETFGEIRIKPENWKKGE